MRRTCVALVMLLSLLAAGCARPAEPPDASATTAQPPGPAGTGTPVAPAEPETVPVGLVLPLTGPHARFGAGMTIAAELAVDRINAAGGPGGRRLGLIVRDGASDPGASAREAEALVRDHGVRALAGVVDAEAALAVARVAVERRVPLFHSGLGRGLSEHDDLDLVWQFHANWSAFGQAIARAALHQRWSTAGVVAENRGGYIDLASGFREWYASWGGRVVVDVAVDQPPTDGDASGYRDLAATVLRDPVDVGVLVASPALTGRILEAWAGTGVPQYWMVMAEGLDPSTLQRLGSRAEYLLAVGMFPDVQGRAYLGLRSEYEARAGETLVQNLFAAHLYDQLVVLALAIETCDCVDAAGLAEAVRRVAGPPGVLVYDPAEGFELLRKGRSIDYEGVSGPLDFDRQGDVLAAFALFTVDEDRLEVAGLLPVTKPPR